MTRIQATSMHVSVRSTKDIYNPVWLICCVAGLAIDRGSAVFILSADANTPYYPQSPPAVGAKLAQDISIHLGQPGNVVHASIPRLAGGRIWFSVGAPLQFALNPGPGLVEPSAFTSADPNYNTDFGFAEFTFNNSQVFVNVSSVDFVGLPISLTLQDTNGTSQHVAGLPANGLAIIADGLRAQTRKDGEPWSSLIVNRDGRVLRILSPNTGIQLNPSWFQNYWTEYVNQAYSRFRTQRLTINTQSSSGNVSGQVDPHGNLNFGSGGSYPPPSAKDIFGCSTGPFATAGANEEKLAIIPRLAAAFNRSTMLITNSQPDGAGPRDYYKNAVTNVSVERCVRTQDTNRLTALRSYRPRGNFGRPRLRLPLR